jgi:hypothetical protein
MSGGIKMIVYNSQVHLANKEWTCSQCGSPIIQGENYARLKDDCYCKDCFFIDDSSSVQKTSGVDSQ